MNDEFMKAGMRFHDWISWLGQPMLYDAGLCVNRSPEEHEERNKHPKAKLMI